MTAREREVFGNRELRDSHARGLADLDSGRVRVFETVEDFLRDLADADDTPAMPPAA